MAKNKVVQAATMKLEVELRCSECNSPLIVNNTWSDIHGLSCYVEPCEECMSRRTQRAGDGATCPRCQCNLNQDGYCLACGYPFPPRA